MRIERLRLLAFGPFTDLEIDLSACATGLHVLYGDNAAGKSTTLRAVRGLLYGIPHDTPDAHRHRNQDLRIGAVLRAADGSVLEVVRRKGRVRTLLDVAGTPIDEAPLLRLLAGVGEEMFANVFGLDHEALRRGGDAILAGGGDVGESLFEAGSGAGGLHALLEELRREADAIFTGQSSKRPLNEAIARFKEASKEARADALSHDAWEKQERGLAEARADHEKVLALRREAEERRRWLERAQRVRPWLARRRRWLADRAALGELPRLAADSAEERRRAQRELEAAQVALARIDEELARLGRDVIAEEDGAQGEVPEGTADALSDLALRLRATRDELTRRRADHERRVEETRVHAARLGPAATAGRLDLAAQAALRELAGAERVLEERRAEAERRVADVQRRARAAEHRWVALGAAIEVGALERVVARALEESDELEAEKRSREAALERARRRSASAAENLAALAGEGPLPADADLEEARRRRDESWRDVRAAWASGDVAAEGREAPRHERLVGEADDLADRLRREAARVTRLAQLRAEREAARVEEDAARADCEELAARQRTHEARFRAELEVGPAHPTPETVTLASLIDRAAAFVDAERERARQVGLAAGLRADAQAELEIVEVEHAARTADLDAWRREWARATAGLGLPDDAGAAAVLAVLDALRDLWAREDEATSAARRLDETLRGARALDEEVHAAVRTWAPDLERLDPEDAVRRLADRAKLREESSRARAAFARQQAERAAEREEARATAVRASARLEALLAAAGARDLAELEQLEERWAAAAELERQLADNAAQLLDAGEGASVEELQATYADLDADRIGAELSDIEDKRLPELEEQARELDYRARALEAGRDRFPGDVRVVHVAEDAQAHLARVRELAHRWVRLRLASTVLSREIEQYREKNQGPVLGRASELFRRLTDGRFRGLRAGWSSADKDRLECLADGVVLEVQELSDGQRDALYLALRLASLERVLETSEPVPLVLDDVLIHMDDQHVRAALHVLADVARRTQVLFFTHNEHVVAIAREAFAERTCVHRLARSEPVTVSAES